MPGALRRARKQGLLERNLDLEHASYFLSHITITPTGPAGMRRWRKKLFVMMARNSASPIEHFELPSERTVIMGSQVGVERARRVRKTARRVPTPPCKAWKIRRRQSDLPRNVALAGGMWKIQARATDFPRIARGVRDPVGLEGPLDRSANGGQASQRTAPRRVSGSGRAPRAARRRRWRPG